MPADCEVHGCGILAVVRCGECNLALCPSHIHEGFGRRRICPNCVERHRIELARIEAETNRMNDGWQLIMEGGKLKRVRRE